MMTCEKAETTARICWRLPDGRETVSIARMGERLLDAAIRAGVFLDAVCNGKGTCGKCAVQVLRGEAGISDADRRLSGAEDLKNGWRLACRLTVCGPLTVRVRAFCPEIRTAGMECPAAAPERTPDGRRMIAVDLGTTTLAAVLTDSDGQILAQETAANPQRVYGADVITRIQASNEGKKEELRVCVCKALEQMFERLCAGADAGRVREIAIAGNTAMLHLLRGYSCETLGRAPFTPVTLQAERLDYRVVFRESALFDGCTVCLLPGLSAFVGADITAGLFSSGFLETDESETALFLDLGTNGEMAAGNGQGFLTASTAAGPALEGAHLSCGVAGVAGAVCRVSFLYHRVRVQTVGQKKPCGICGSGALDAVAALLKEGLLDKDGLLAPPYFENGFALAQDENGRDIALTQADIREIQMAKAAVRAGMDTLLFRYREKTGKRAGPDRIYLSGGLGTYLSAETAAAVGLVPPEWKGRITVCGNSSLRGAVRFLTDSACAREMENIRLRHGGISLAEDPLFRRRYIDAMGFPEEMA